jgi:hypothetical protein
MRAFRVTKNEIEERMAETQPKGIFVRRLQLEKAQAHFVSLSFYFFWNPMQVTLLRNPVSNSCCVFRRFSEAPE